MANRCVQWMSGVLIRLSKIHSRKGLYPFLKCEFEKIHSGQTVLNVGASGEIGAMLSQSADKQGFCVLSLDVDSKRNPDIVADLHDWRPDCQFDVVVMAGVLEHCHSPNRANKTVEQVLRGGGKLILTTPFIFPIHDAPYDYYRFTKFGLAHLLANFAEVHIEERNQWTEGILVLLVRLVMEKSKICRIVSPLFIGVAFILWPLAWLLARVLKATHITTGYCVTARKGRGSDDLLESV